MSIFIVYVYRVKQAGEHIVDFFFFFNDTATTEIYTLSLHDALPIWAHDNRTCPLRVVGHGSALRFENRRSEEHTSELQSQSNLVCRLLLEKKKQKAIYTLRTNFILTFTLHTARPSVPATVSFVNVTS